MYAGANLFCDLYIMSMILNNAICFETGSQWWSCNIGVMCLWQVDLVTSLAAVF